MKSPYSPSLTTIRVGLVITLPFVVAWAFLSTLATEMKDACWYAWNAGQQEAEAFRRYWRGGWAAIQRNNAEK
jgi:hypothetical protein